ncbi:S1 RNA-binding domain-containing protein [Streptomyces mirabilis]|uniref:S1 RNA-binding domain-containing protein n=1 Tax=Streptomyces mirabilis TaxID=68239 RepID=UPI0036DABEC4
MTNGQLSEHEQRLIGEMVDGEVEAVFRWGIIVDLGLSRVGLIDALYIDDEDNYQVGDRVSGYLDCFDEQKEKFILRPPDQISLAERLRRAREQ